MPETTDIIEAQIEKFDALREAFESENARCFLLKRSEHSGGFEVVFELTGGWYQRWSEYRQATRIAYATLDDSFADLAAQTSYFAYGVPDADGAIGVYRTEDDQRDRVIPNGANPYWKFYVLRQENERFVVPDLMRAASYKVLRAIISQTGTDPIVFERIVENTLGAPLAWSTDGFYSFYLNAPAAFSERSRIWWQFEPLYRSDVGVIRGEVALSETSGDALTIRFRESFGNLQNLGGKSIQIEIRVYD